MPERVIDVVAYDPEWPRHFDQIRAYVANAVGDHALDIEHVGSTAVPGLSAKPIIDVDVIVRPTEMAEAIRRLDRASARRSAIRGPPRSAQAATRLAWGPAQAGTPPRSRAWGLVEVAQRDLPHELIRRDLSDQVSAAAQRALALSQRFEAQARRSGHSRRAAPAIAGSEPA